MATKISPQTRVKFFNAIVEKDPALVREMLADGIPADISDKEGMSALVAAAAAGEPRTVELLISAGCHVNSLDSSGSLALVAAAESGATHVVEMLLAAKADPNVVDGMGRTPLAFAAATNNTHGIQLLLAAGADIDKTTVVVKPVDHNKIPKHSLCNALMAACGHGARAAVDLLLERGADPSLTAPNGWTCAHFLFERTFRATPLAEKYEERTLETLLSKGLSPNVVGNDGQTVFTLGLEHQASDEVFRILLKHGAKPDYMTADGTSLIHIAAKKGRHLVLRSLLKAGVDVDTQDPEGQTALFNFWQKDVGKVLLANGADVNHQDKKGNTALHHKLEQSAVPERIDDVIELLIEADPSFEIKNNAKKTVKDIVDSRKMTGCAPLLAAAMARSALKAAATQARASHRFSH